MGRPVPQLVGKTFGRLTVLARDGSVKGHSKWLCRCACGTEYRVLAVNLIHGRTRSCGCYFRETRGRAARRHGQSNTREHNIWCGVRRRCLDPRHKTFAHYGAKGVTVCDRWRDSFAAFILDMGPAPPGTSIDRIDNAKGYEPGNCRWATIFEQAANKRNARTFEYDGKALSAAGWGRLVGLPSHVIAGRMRLGWTIDRALSEPIHGR